MRVFAQHARHDEVLLVLISVVLITLQVVIVWHIQSAKEESSQ